MHSFDLVAGAPGVVACNMAAVPLEPASVDVALFCLALMGTDYGSFLQVRGHSGVGLAPGCIRRRGNSLVGPTGAQPPASSCM